MMLSKTLGRLSRTAMARPGACFLHTRATSIRTGPTGTAITQPMQHLLENENEYGIAERLHMDHFKSENYNEKIKETVKVEQNLQSERHLKTSTPLHASALILEDDISFDQGVLEMQAKPKKVKVDPTKIHLYKHNLDEAEF